jgi:hypothetical protein
MATVGDALELAGRGFRVFPLRENDWRPQIKGWVDAATTDEATIRRWWAQWPKGNVGVATGQGLVVIDIDNKKGKNGSASFADLDLPIESLDTFTVETPSGGRHVYFDARTLNGRLVYNSAGTLGLGLDVRGDGGYVVGPGSFLPDGVKDGQTGGIYTNLVHAAPRPLPLCISACLGGAPIGIDDHKADDSRGSSGSYSVGSLLAAAAKPAIQGIGGDHQTYVVAATLRDYGLSEEDAFDALIGSGWNDRCEPPWEIEDLKVKVANAYAYAENPPGSKSPEVQFNGVDVPPVIVPPRKPSKWLDHGAPIERDGLWLLPEIVPATGVGVLVAKSQSGKTFLFLELARCVATGKPFFKVTPDEKGATLIVFSGTEGSGLARRMAALGEATALPISAMVVGNLTEKGALDGLLADLKEKTAWMERTFGVPVRLIIIETIAASGLLNDENSNAEASRAIANLGAISLAMKAPVFASHHPSKDGKAARGAGAITDNCDFAMEIHRNGRDKVRQVELVKARDAEQRTLGSFSLLPVDLGMDTKGRPITSMTVSMGEAEAPAMKASKHAPLLMECIDWATMEDGREIEGKMCVDKKAVWIVFKERCKSPTDESNKHKVYKAALDFLESQGAFETVDVGSTAYICKREIII